MATLRAGLLLVLTLITSTVHAAPVKALHVTVDLLAESTAVVPGKPLWLLLQFTPEDGWHTYWKNPGDSGLAPVLKWQLPTGWQARAPQFPTPEAIPYGSQMNYGYHGANGLLVELVPPDHIDTAAVELQLDARWLVCADACVPGRGEFRLMLPVANALSVNPEHALLFASTRAALPVALDGEAVYRVTDDHVRVEIPSAGLPADTLQVFVAPGQIAEPGAKPLITRQNDRLLIQLTRHTYFSDAPDQIEVVLTRSGKGWSVPARFVSP
jgi:DsbC/DsbD-like thiol-disulfide interchange protein